MWQACSDISLPIITFNLQFLAAFIYSCSRISANTLPIQKASLSERHTFSATTERVLMETRHPDAFGSLAHPAWACLWVPTEVIAPLVAGAQSGAVMVQSALPAQNVIAMLLRSATLSIISHVPDSAWLSSGHRVPCPSPARAVMDTPRGARGALFPSQPLPASSTMTELDEPRGCSSHGDLPALPRAPLQRGMARAPGSLGLYACTASADPSERQCGLSHRRWVHGAIGERLSLPGPRSPGRPLSPL